MVTYFIGKNGKSDFNTGRLVKYKILERRITDLELKDLLIQARKNEKKKISNFD